MKLQNIRYLMIGLGFFWIFCATVLGTLIGAKINTALTHDINGSWLFGLQKTLLVSAHSHMNLMSMITILIGLVLSFIWGQVSSKLLKYAIFFNLISMPLFVFGLLLKALFLESNQFLFTGVMAFGAILYIISVGIFSSFFLFLFARRH